MKMPLVVRVQIELLKADNVVSVGKSQDTGRGRFIVPFTLEGDVVGESIVLSDEGAYFYIGGEPAHWFKNNVVLWEGN